MKLADGLTNVAPRIYLQRGFAREICLSLCTPCCSRPVCRHLLFELEITESVLIDDFGRGQAILRRLKSLGVKIAMDDFGTGYSSLSYLQSFPFDKIKVDRSFVSDLETNNNNAAIVRAVITLARSLNLPVLAEGVETEAQRLILNQEGCDQIQGHLIGKPLPILNYASIINSLQRDKDVRYSNQVGDIFKRTKPRRRVQVH